MSEREVNAQGACAYDVLRTVAYFTSLGMAMTPTDVWRWLYKPVSPWKLAEVLLAIHDQRAQSRLTMRDGRVVLAGHEGVFTKQHDMFLDAYRKWKRARRVARWTSLIPGVRAVAVGNTLAWEATTVESDIDMFVVARAGTLWLVRFLCVTPLILLGARPGKRKRDAIDFTFFLSDTALDLSHLRIEPEDPYLTYWLASLVPFVDDGVMRELWESNTWMQEALPHATPVKVSWYRRIRHGQWLGEILYKSLKLTRLLSVLDRLARTISERRFPAAIREQQNVSSHVVVNNNMLKFHVTDNRASIYTTWTQLIKHYEALS